MPSASSAIAPDNNNDLHEKLPDQPETPLQEETREKLTTND